MSRYVQSLSVFFWNIDGMHYRLGKSRFNKCFDDAVLSVLKCHDIICLVETHCSYSDSCDLEHYSAVMNIRPKAKKAKKHSGGMTVLVKKSIRPGVIFLPVTSSELMWLKLDKSFFKCADDIYLAVVYASPESSPYSKKSDDIFDLLECDIAKYNQLGKCLLLRDFNASTSTEPDFCTSDDARHLLDLPYNYIQDTALRRNNVDSRKVDCHGEKLLNLCKSAGMRIANGRKFGDTLGYPTCFSPVAKKPSLIDYCIASETFLTNIRNLVVYNLTPIPYTAHYQLKSILAVIHPL